MNAATAHATPADATDPVPARQSNRSALPVWMAAAWTIALFLLLPAINRIGPPPTATVVFVLQVVVTLVSLVAASVLLFRPRKRWLLLTIPFASFLLIVTGTVWTHFP
jgi:hypothetical protein